MSAQLGLYRALLARLYPDCRCACLLVWTTGPVLAEIPAARLDAALASISFGLIVTVRD